MKVLSALFALLLLISPGLHAVSDDPGGQSFVGLSRSRSARTVEAFKAEQYTNLFERQGISVAETAILSETESGINSLSERLKRTMNARESYESRMLQARGEKRSLRSMISDMDKEIAKIEKKVSLERSIIAQSTVKIADITKKTQELEQQIDLSRKVIADYVIYIYTHGSNVYESGSIDIIKTLVMNSGSLSDVLNEMETSRLLRDAWERYIGQHRTLVSQLYDQQQDLKSEKKRSREAIASLTENELIIEEQKSQKRELLRITRGKESKFQEYVNSRKASEEKLVARIDSLTDRYDSVLESVKSRSGCTSSGSLAATGTMLCSELEAMYSAEKALRSYMNTNGLTDTLSGNIAWPTALQAVSAYYHDENYYDSVGASHDAIDIPTPQGTDISSPLPGYVLYVNDVTPTSYAYLAIKHPGGFVTVYGHLSEIAVKPYELILPWQIIAKTGGAAGTPGAGPMTSGAHLHFELFKNRESVDPLRYMDVSGLPFESIPGKYRYKFVQDLKLKYGSRANTRKYNTFRILGDTEKARQEYLLQRYAAPNFRDWDTWVEESQLAGLDPSFLMCIGLSESTLGNRLKTAYNIGNVGNTDSGGTYTFTSPREGIYWMARTLRNKYLGQYNYLTDLSRWGNKDPNKPIYASSKTNWHNNMIRCLSSLKGYFVEDDFQFRTWAPDTLIKPE